MLTGPEDKEGLISNLVSASQTFNKDLQVILNSLLTVFKHCTMLIVGDLFPHRYQHPCIIFTFILIYIFVDS